MRIFTLLLSLSLCASLTPATGAEPGDRMLAAADVAIRYQKTASGIRLARASWAKPSHIAGMITDVDRTSFEVLTGPRARSSPYQNEHARVRFDSGTLFLDSNPGDLESGRNVDIIGVRLKNGDLLAARVIIYEGDCPVRTPDGSILFHVLAESGHGTKPVLPSPCDSRQGSL